MKKSRRQIKLLAQRFSDWISVTFFKILYGNNSYKYTLLGDTLYTREPIRIHNTRIKVVRQNLKSSNEIAIISEDAYLLLLYEDNLAHFFHDIFFPLYVVWRKNKKKVFASINDNQLLKDFLIAIFGEEYIIFSKRHVSYRFNQLTLMPEGRDLKLYPNYIYICKEIRDRCFNTYEITANRTKNLLYGRNELKRKNLLNIDDTFLAAHGIEKVTLSSLPFRELVSLLAQAKSFTYMVGAGVFYLLFLDNTVSVLEINPARNNSWAQMFGMDRLCNFHVLVSQSIEMSNQPAQADSILDSHVYFDDNIKKGLLSILTS